MRSAMVMMATIVLAGAVAVSPEWPAAVIANRASGLRTYEVGRGRVPFVLLHGYGSTPDQWLPFTQTIMIAERRRFVFPEAPETTTPPDGPLGGRAWWRLDLASYRTPPHAPDMSRARPAGLDRSVDVVQRLMTDLQRRLGYAPDQAILGGFSQGAMISADVAFRTRMPMRALVLLSGTIVDEAGWLASMPARRGLPVFIAHGRRDDVLPFDLSLRLQQTMREAGLEVTWVPFEGGHEIPVEVVTALNAFLARVGRPAP